MDRGQDAIRPASEAAELFEVLGSARMRPGRAIGSPAPTTCIDNAAQAQGILQQLLADVQAGLEVAPDFRFRLLTQLGNAEAWDGDPERAIGYMEEARSLLGVGVAASARRLPGRVWRSSTGVLGTSSGRSGSATRAWPLYDVLHDRARGWARSS